MRWAFVVVLGLAGCARVAPLEDASREGSADAGREHGERRDELVGRATYYSDRLAGHATASGEPYDPRRLTAAHRTLPLGTVVDVMRSDGRTVRVRINDRGPFGHSERIIDLSKQAAAALGMLRAGVVDVSLRVID